MKQYDVEEQTGQGELSRRLGRLLAAILALVAVLMVGVRTSAAWYRLNRQTDTASGVTSVGPELVMDSGTIYWYPERNGTCSSASLTDSLSLTLMDYDTLIQKRNDQTAAILVIPITGSALTADAGAFALCLTRSEHTDSSTAYLSDRVTVRCVPGSASLSQGDDDAVYAAVKAYLEQDTVPAQAFAAGENSLTFSFSCRDYAALAEGDTLYVYMEIDYDPDSVADFVAGDNPTGQRYVIRFGQTPDMPKFTWDIQSLLLISAQGQGANL